MADERLLVLRFEPKDLDPEWTRTIEGLRTFFAIYEPELEVSLVYGAIGGLANEIWSMIEADGV